MFEKSLGMSALVDIIVPTYKRPEYLKKALESVLDQTENSWLCLVAEDGESDEIREIVEYFAASGPFSYLPGSHSGIPARQRNRAIRKGQSEYIAFLDDDDIWLPTKLETQLAFMKAHPDCVLAGSNAFRFKGDPVPPKSHETYFTTDLPTGSLSFEKLVHDNIFINSSVITRRQVLEQSGLLNENPDLAGLEDYELWLRIGSLGMMWYDSCPLVYYRDNPDSSIRSHHSASSFHRRMAAVYRAAVTEASSPLRKRENARFADLCTRQTRVHLREKSSLRYLKLVSKTLKRYYHAVLGKL